MALPLALTPSATLTKQSISPAPSNTIQSFLSVTAKPAFPDMRNNYQHTVVEPKLAAEKAAADKAAEEAAQAAAQAAVYVVPQVQEIVRPSTFGGLLVGSYGYSLAGGNCVDTARAYGKLQPGNPISWVTTTNRPFIGAAALFPFNHVAIVVGIWSNGDIEVAQQNAPGAPHRYSQSEIRGYF